MPSKFQILRSETTRNIFRNPSAELDLQDWQGVGSGISRSQSEARFGRHSVRVFTNGIVDNEGVYVRSFPNTQALPYAGSIYVRGRGRVRLRMRDATNGIDRVTDPFSLETASDLPLPPCDPNDFIYDQANSNINCGSDATIDNLPTSANGFTAEGWALADGFGGGGIGRLFGKTSWLLRDGAADGLRSQVQSAVQNAISVSGLDDWTTDGEWHHIATTYEDITRLIRIFIDGFEASYTLQQPAIGAYVGDTASDLIIGNNAPLNNVWDGKIGWVRISNFLRYTENFLPPGRCALPEIDQNTVAQWIGVEADGEGDLVENQQGDPNLDGIAANITIDCECEDPARGRRWHRPEVIGEVGGQPSDDLRLYIETVGIQETAFYVDAAQMEQKTYVTTYIDGDQDGGRWNIQRQLSVSDRLSNDRLGGRFIDIDLEELGIYATITSGIGMPPLIHNLQGKALAPGVEFQSTKIQARSITLTVWAKPTPSCPGALAALHKLRQEMIDIVKPDRVDPDQPFILRYNGGAIPLDIEVLYEAGLEFDGDIRNQFFNSFIVRFLASDPFWREDNQHVAILDPIDVLQTREGFIGKQNRAWTNFDLVDDRIVAMAIGPDGVLYVAGEFTVIGGVMANGIAGYDGTDFFPLGNGIDNFLAAAIAFGPDGSLYLGGSFLSVAGVANTEGIARWDFATETWNSVSGGLDGNVNAIAFAPNGSMFVAGVFGEGDPNGVPVTANSIIELIQSGSWLALVDTGTGGGNGLLPIAANFGLEVVVAPDGLVYVGGIFANAGLVASTANLALWTPSIRQFSSLGGDANASINAMGITEDGKVFIGGLFTDIGGVSLNRAAIWNGSSWSQLAGGLNGASSWIFIEESGRVWYVGVYTEALDVDDIAVPNINKVAIWDGSQWIPPDFTVPANLLRMDTIVTKGEDRFYGGDSVGDPGNALVSVPNTDIDSLATSISYPIFHFRRDAGSSATLIQILNEDTRREMTFIYEMSDGEEIEVDFRPGRRTVQSSLFNVAIDVAEAFRNRLDTVVPGSDFANFSLIPGQQTITVFITILGNVTLEATMRWQPLHWSVDAGGL